MRSFATVIFALVGTQTVFGAPTEAPKDDLHADSLVAGGQIAQQIQFPYQVSLFWGLSPGVADRRLICGGSILNELWVLTAAHCFTKFGKGYYRVYAGKQRLDIYEATQQVRDVVQANFNIGYIGDGSPHDIALMKLAAPLILNSNVSPVVLPQPHVQHSGNVILSGWGSLSTNFTDVFPVNLRSAILPIIDNSNCLSIFEGIIFNPVINTCNICTGNMNGSSGACFGDSGGPIVQYNSAGKPELVGVVSWTHRPCGSSPSVYVRVSTYITWITKTIQLFSP